jgi:hypothetical protein
MHIFEHADGKTAQGEEVFQDTFRSQSCVTEYTPGEALSSGITLYSSALNDPPEYCTDPSMLPLHHPKPDDPFPRSKVETN